MTSVGVKPQKVSKTRCVASQKKLHLIQNTLTIS